MNAYEARLKSFKTSHKLKHPSKSSTTTSIKWPHPASFKATPETLAEAGFYFAPAWHDRDNTTCYACGKEISDWEGDDDPFEIHWAKCKSCPYAIVRCSLLEDVDEDGSYLFASASRLPTHKTFEKARQDTFTVIDDSWPHDATRGHGAHSKRMATAGFIFTPQYEGDDSATCLYCSLTLSGWDAGDDPTEEHRKRASRSGKPCPFFYPTLVSGASGTTATTKTKPKASTSKPKPPRSNSRQPTAAPTDVDSGSDDELAAAEPSPDVPPAGSKKGRAASKTPAAARSNRSQTTMSSLTTLPSTAKSRKTATATRSKEPDPPPVDESSGEDETEEGAIRARHVSKSAKGAAAKRAATKKAQTQTQNGTREGSYMDVQEPLRDPELESGGTGASGRGRRKGRSTSRARSKSRAPSDAEMDVDGDGEEYKTAEDEERAVDDEPESGPGSKKGKPARKSKAPTRASSKPPSSTASSKRSKKGTPPDAEVDGHDIPVPAAAVHTPAMDIDPVPESSTKPASSSKSRSGGSKSRTTRMKKTTTPVITEEEEEEAPSQPPSRTRSKARAVVESDDDDDHDGVPEPAPAPVPVPDEPVIKKPPSKVKAPVSKTAKGKVKASKSPAVVVDENEEDDVAPLKRSNSSQPVPQPASKTHSRQLSNTSTSSKSSLPPILEAKKREASKPIPTARTLPPPPSPSPVLQAEIEADAADEPEPEPEPEPMIDLDPGEVDAVMEEADPRTPSPHPHSLEESYLPPPSAPPTDTAPSEVSEAEDTANLNTTAIANPNPNANLDSESDDEHEANFVERSLDISVPINIKEGRRVPRRSTPLPSPSRFRSAEQSPERPVSPTDAVRERRLARQTTTPQPAPPPPLPSQAHFDSMDVDVDTTVKEKTVRITTPILRTPPRSALTLFPPAPAPGTSTEQIATTLLANMPPPESPAPPILAPLATVPMPPMMKLSDAEREMTVEEWIRHEMEQQYNQLKVDGEARIEQFRQHAAEMRKRIEAL